MELEKALYRPNDIFGKNKIIPISRAAGYQLIADGEIETMRVGRSILVPRESIRKWIEKQVKVSVKSKKKASAKHD
jgi:excisionase family DNA binding protein